MKVIDMSTTEQTLYKFHDGLIVSCQALEDEPLYGSHIMAAMAVAAEQGGAVGIRANTPADIRAIKQRCSLPVLGLYKANYPGFDVLITPTFMEARQIIEAGADLVALDATSRPRPNGETLAGLVTALRSAFPQTGIIADISTYEEGLAAIELGVDAICTTLSGYTSYSTTLTTPDVQLVKRLASLQKLPIIAEGRIWTTAEARECMLAGAHSVVVGTAITRPQEITKRFVEAMKHGH
jgi:N-acylglucosamine-6-phosphate 2-epimerase